jgi:hypothetical protein
MMNEYSYLWDGSSASWALLHLNAGNMDEAPRYLIVNIESKRTLLISDDALYAKVKQAMLDHGVRVVTSDSF